jgi:serine/threonine protein kinase
MHQEVQEEEGNKQLTDERYVYMGKLGKGTYGRVVLAMDKTTQEMVAIKRIIFHVILDHVRTKKKATLALR